jgi:hypothetical protein
MVMMVMFLATACREPEDQVAVPALLTNPGPESRQEIEMVVANALNGAKVTLADDVLTKNSVLVIERGMQRAIDRPPELGRDLGRPYRFQLVSDGSECALVDQQDGRRWTLTGVECVKE